MTCKECVHYDVCVIVENQVDKEDDYYTEFGCDDFKSKSRFIELPCEVGQTVYTVNKARIKGHWEDNRWIVDVWDKWKVCEIPFSLTLFECGKGTYYLTKEEAENALKERKKE